MDLTRTSRLSTLMAAVRGKNLQAFLNQAIVSGTNFATIAIVGNACGTSGLGYYALGFSVIIFSLGLQSALVSIPFTVFFAREEAAARPGRVGSSFMNHLIVATGTSLLVGICAVVLFAAQSHVQATIATCLVLVIPCVHLREFARRVCFANLDFNTAVRLDAMVAFIQLGSLLLLWSWNGLSPTRALGCVGVACVLPTLIYLVMRKSAFALLRGRVAGDITHDWRYGRWLVAEQAITIASTYVMPWLIAIYLDSAAVGIFAACFSITGLSNPFLQGVGNYLLPVFSNQLATDRTSALRETFWRYSSLTVAAMTLFLLICTLFGEDCLTFIYRQESYAGFGAIVALLAVRAFVGSVGLTAHYYLLAVGNPKVSFVASSVSVAIMILSGALLIPGFQLHGAAITWILASIGESLVMIAGYRLNRPGRAGALA